MQFDAVHCELNRKGGGMRPLFVATLDRLVGHEPGVAATTQIVSAGVTPARDVGFVRVGNAEREAVDRSTAFCREMEDVLMAIIQVTRRVDRLEMTARDVGA